MESATMFLKSVALLAGFLASASAAGAQTLTVHVNPAPGCSVSREEQEANRQVAMDFYKPGLTPAQRVALFDPNYIQHNPVFRRLAQQQGISDYQAAVNVFGAAGRAVGAARAGGAGAAGERRGAVAARQPPPGNNYEVVTAECDLVTMVRRLVLQDPTAAPGTWYETFAFDTFRVRNGKLVEHWDGAVLNPPPAPGPPTGMFGGNLGHIVSDLARATAFYQDVLGLTVRANGAAPYPWAENPALRAASMATVEIPGGDWALDLVQRAQAQAAFRPRMQDPGALTLILYVSNVDDVLARARAANAPVVTIGGTTGVGANRAQKASVIQAPDGEFIELLEQTPRGVTASSVLRASVRVTVASADEAAVAFQSLLGVPFRGGPAPVADAGVPPMLGLPDATFHLRIGQLPGSGMTFELLEIAGPDKSSVRVEPGTPGSSYLRVGLTRNRMPAAGAATDRDNVFMALREVQP
jgi:predicted SnoaL-like aldol condensation-catalyzing enzyme/catechol 2,3-dioxygenase-like lactoylglutathione lyase family enzyme